MVLRGAIGLAAVGLVSLLASACSRGDFHDATSIDDTNVGPDPAFSGDGGSDADGPAPTCATAKVPITRTTIFMQIILDGSGSMNDPLAPGGASGLKWKAASEALVSFFDDLLAKKDLSFGVGLFLFDGTKGVPDFLVPDVSIRQVDATQHAALKSRITQSTPQGGTPIKLALEGQIPLLEKYVAQGSLKAKGKRVLVVITDGVPDGPADVQPTVQGQCVKLVADALAHSPPITTFAVGVGDPASDESTYNEVFVGRLASAGGAAAPGCSPGWNQSSPAGQTPCHFQITPATKTAAQIRAELLAAIDAIRGAVSTCEFTLVRPDGTTGVADPSRVNVVLTTSDGKVATVPQDAIDGWTYDDATTPTTVIFHGAACDRVKSETDGKVEIELGCKTLVK
jgi:von Willebrand factor type A domain